MLSEQLELEKVILFLDHRVDLFVLYLLEDGPASVSWLYIRCCAINACQTWQGEAVFAQALEAWGFAVDQGKVSV